MISNNSIRNLIKEYTEAHNLDSVEVSKKAVEYFKLILKETVDVILDDTLKWETDKRITETNIRNSMSKRGNIGKLLFFNR